MKYEREVPTAAGFDDVGAGSQAKEGLLEPMNSPQLTAEEIFSFRPTDL